MREILFRGKRADNGKWVDGELLHDMQNRPHLYWKTPKELPIVFSNHAIVDPATLGQFTGLTDKNGKKIFEGDICRVCLDPEICIGDVIWDGEIASYNILFNNGKCVLPLDIWIAKNKVGDKVWVEIIGNIHDNPELMGVTDNA